MPTYLSPGVYMEEVSSGSKPIEGVGTAVAAFVGFAEKGPANQPTLVTNWTQFTQSFGDFVDGLVPRARGLRVLPQRRRRGIRRAHRCGRRRRPAAARRRAELPAGGERQAAAWSVKALEGGPAGDEITVEIADARREPADDDVQADRQARRQGRGDVRQRHARKRGPNNVGTVVKAESKLIPSRRSGPPVRTTALHKGAGQRSPAATGASPGARAARTTTSATPPTAPASAASRRSTRSRCCACPT